MPTQSKTGQAGDIETTAQMNEAGIKVYRDWQHDNWERAAPNAEANLVARVYTAMEEVRRISGTKTERERVLNALDRLALALVERGHRWTQVERRAYETAVRLLS